MRAELHFLFYLLSLSMNYILFLTPNILTVAPITLGLSTLLNYVEIIVLFTVYSIFIIYTTLAYISSIVFNLIMFKNW